MITYFRRTIKERRLKRLSKFKVGSWINVVDPTDGEIEILVKKFNLDKQNLLSGLDKNEIPRLDIENKKTYVFVKTIIPGTKELQTFLIVLSERFILTLSEHAPSFMKDVINGKAEIITTQRLKCLIKILSMINKEFEYTTIDTVKRVRSRKSAVNELTDKDVNELLVYEELLNSLIFYYYHMLLLYRRIIKTIGFYEKDKETIEDLIVEADEGFNLCKSSLKTISNIREHYMILLSNKLNRVITILTLVTVFISIPAAISGIYGMNIRLPIQHNPFAFYIILGIIAAIWVGFLAYFKSRKII